MNQEVLLIITQLNDILIEGKNTNGISIKNIDLKNLTRVTSKVDSVIELVETKNITQTNNLIEAAGVCVADRS